MDGFKSLPKMQCFREGGSVKSKPVAKCSGGKMKEGGKADLAQDKAVVKKAFAMHDKQEHHGEKTDLSKLKKGGRSKKAVGTVKKFANGGSVDNEYSAKKSSGDKDNIRKTKLIKPAKAAAPSKAATKPNFAGSDVVKEKGKSSGYEDPYIKSKQSGKKAVAPSGAKGPNAYKKGGKVAKCAVGGQPGATEAQQKYYNKNKADAKVKEDKAMYEAIGSRGDAARKGMAEGRMDQMGNAFKKGGKAKVKKFAEGGSTGSFSPDEEKWLGGADRTDPFILARMRAAMGDKKPVAKPTGSYIPNANPAMDNRDIGETGGSIDDESKFGVVSPAAAAFNKDIPGAGPVAAAPSAPVRRAAPVLPAGPSADDRMRMKYARPYSAPNVEQDSGLDYPIKPTFTSATPGQQATQFNKGIEARKNVGKRIGDFLGLNKKPVG